MRLLYSEQKKKKDWAFTRSLILFQNSQNTLNYSLTRILTSEGIFQNSHLCITCLDLFFNKISASSWKPVERTVRAKKSYDINRFYLYMIDKNHGQKKRKIWWSQTPPIAKLITWSKISWTFFFSLLYP